MRTNGAGRPIGVVRPDCRHNEGPWHDCGYVDAVNRLIQAVGAAADDAVDQAIEERGGALPSDYDDADGMRTRRASLRATYDWSRAFHEEMQSACELSGLRRPGPRRE